MSRTIQKFNPFLRRQTTMLRLYATSQSSTNNDDKSKDDKSKEDVEQKAKRIAANLTMAGSFGIPITKATLAGYQKLSEALKHVDYRSIAGSVMNHRESHYFAIAVLAVVLGMDHSHIREAAKEKLTAAISVVKGAMKQGMKAETYILALEVVKKLVVNPMFRAQVIESAAEMLDFSTFGVSLVQILNLGLGRLEVESDHVVEFRELSWDGSTVGSLYLSEHDRTKKWTVTLCGQLLFVKDEQGNIKNDLAEVPTSNFEPSEVWARVAGRHLLVFFPKANPASHDIRMEVEVPVI